MNTLLYLHGFLSSPQSHKAQLTREWLAANRPDIDFVCPQLPSYPEESYMELLTLVEALKSDQLWLIGSSLGGFWANILLEKQLAARAVLVNPAVTPGKSFLKWLGRPMKHYYLEQEITLGDVDSRYLNQCEAPAPAEPAKYWVMLQTGDETLDYRLAAKKYQACKLLVEEGGNHSFTGYADWLPEIIHFFETSAN
ncbi:MAG: alpha/beta fold hydrolase [Cellvibrionaceae bacterium]|nr:alpha/beta fold hydrolase [Cellvibrionaceae bacterium]